MSKFDPEAAQRALETSQWRAEKDRRWELRILKKLITGLGGDASKLRYQNQEEIGMAWFNDQAILPYFQMGTAIIPAFNLESFMLPRINHPLRVAWENLYDETQDSSALVVRCKEFAKGSAKALVVYDTTPFINNTFQLGQIGHISSPVTYQGKSRIKLYIALFDEWLKVLYEGGVRIE